GFGDHGAEVDGAAVAELAGPDAELMPAVILRERPHAGQQARTAEHLGEAGRRALVLRQADFAQHLARAGQRAGVGEAERLHRGPARAAYLAARVLRVRIARQFFHKAVIEREVVERLGFESGVHGVVV